MFGGAKPNFGAAANTPNFSGFGNASTTSAFGQSAFSKPASSAFGATPAFGAQQTTPSLFGQPAAPTQQTGLFGTATTSGAFGGTTTAPSTFGGFSQPQQNTSIFGATQNASNASLFGQSGTSAFGAAVKPGGLAGFGQTATAQPSASLFGQQAASAPATGFGGFGQSATPTANVFGSGAASAFGQPQTSAAAVGGNSGTSIVKYQPIVGTDTLMKGGAPSNISTKQHCITAMKEYEQKSLEELRMEDYIAGRKGPQGGAPPGGFFGGATAGTQPAAPTTGLFGTTTQPATNLFGQTPTAGTENKGLFGQNAFGQPAATNAFGANTQQNNFMAKPFGAPNTTGFGATSTDASNPFGPKPAFGQAPTGGLFGQTSVANTTPAFGQPNTGGFGGFGTTQATQQPSLFGNTNQADANKPTFGIGNPASAANTGFAGFGTTATSTAGGGSLFGAKPATGFGTAPAFGATSTANTGFGNFSMNNTATSGAGLFNSSLNKPATSGFAGFGAQATAPLTFNAGNPGGSLFGNTAAKPGLFGGNTGLGAAPGTGGGLFGGTTNAFGANNSLGGGFGTLGSNTTLSGGLGGTPQQHAAVPIHQQILAKVTSPYGDTPIFKDLKRNDEADAARATNPAAQQAIIDTSNNQFKIDAKDSPSVIKVKPINSSLNRRSLFDGLEQYDASVESFSLKPSAKRLVINPKSKQTPSSDPDKNTSSVKNSTTRINHASELPTTNNNPVSNSAPLEAQAASSSDKVIESDITRRESWLHQPVRQHNLASGLDNDAPFNSTLTELVPRKPLETFRPSAGGRLSVSTIPENPFEDQTSSISRRDTVTFTSEQPNESALSNRSGADQEERLATESSSTDQEPHPTGITLKRIGYYTIPGLDDLKSYITEDGSCIVPNFTVGREGYGNVYFGKEMDVAGLNLDEIVHFRNKEIIVYPDDDKKPPIGNGLNRDAQVTLDQVWPHDKTKHEPIKDPQRLDEMDWEGKLRRVCDKNDTRFIEYRPETGSWVFRVKHFSKYGLSDSDEEGDDATEAKKPKLAEVGAIRPQLTKGTGQMTLSSLKNAQKISEEAARALDPKTLAAGVAAGFYPMDDTAEFMLMDKTQFFQASENDLSLFESSKMVKSPTAALVKEVTCNDSHKLQLMKSSLFEDSEFDRQSALEQKSNFVMPRNNRKSAFGRAFISDAVIPTDGSSETSSQFDFGRSSPPVPASSPESVLSILREVQSETSSPAPDSESTTIGRKKTSQEVMEFVIEPEIAPIKSNAYNLALRQSLAHPLCQTWSVDLGIFRSHIFKTGFGPKNSFIVPTTHNNRCIEKSFSKLCDAVPKIFKTRDADDVSPTMLQHVKISSTRHYNDFKDTVVPHLEILLTHVIANNVEGSDCIWFQSDSGTDLIVKHLDEAIKTTVQSDAQEYAVSVWSLLLALWGDHEQLEGQDGNSHFAVMCRRSLFSEWLENILVEKDMLSKQISKHTYLEHMMDLLMCHKVNEACELAFSYDDCYLSLLLAQLSSGPVVRQLVEDQLASWHMTKADEHISVERLKMFMMVAGVPLMDSAHGPLNVLENINWIKVLALQLWYFTSPTSSVTDALLAYEKSFATKEFYSQPPTPSYTETLYNRARTVYDLRYHILQLYSKRSHPLECLLNPATHTDDPMDYRLSWLLLQTLEALGYKQCPELTECHLHVGFATQLENNGLWEWAIFVLLHIKNRNQREIAVQNLLYRYVSVSKEVVLTEQEKFVITRLGVPEKWIDYAKAVKAGASRQYHLQAKYLLKAKQWALAHEVIYQHIAPDAIIKGNLSYLQNLMSQFECSEQRTNVRVPNWSNQGQIFLDYIDVTEKFKQIKAITSTADIEARWENLKSQIEELCSRINLLPCPTAKHRLCQSEIAQNLACLVRGMLIVCPNLNPCLIIKIALERLPLPQEFAKKELHALLKSLISDITKVSLSEKPETLSSLISSQGYKLNVK